MHHPRCAEFRSPESTSCEARLFGRYPEVLVGQVNVDIGVGNYVGVAQVSIGEEQSHRDRLLAMAGNVGRHLRAAWDAPDLRHFDWYTWTAQAEHNLTWYLRTIQRPDSPALAHITLEQSIDPPATVTPVEAAIFYLRHNRNRALHCPNPECPAPYFFASKKGQKYCSPECAKPAQRAAKRQWWAENRAKGGLRG